MAEYSRILTDVVLFYKTDCGLCDQVLAELQEFIRNFGLERQVCLQLRDILDKTEWYDQYSERIPVVMVNNQEVCHFFFDKPALCRALGIEQGQD